MTEIIQEAVDLVKHFEGKYLEAYHDPVGIVTIGYGYTNRAGYGDGVKMGDVWTEEKAERMLVEGLSRFADRIRPHFKRQPTPNQFGAFVSLAYNIGPSAFARSTALRKFNAGNFKDAADAILMWNKAGGKVLRGLVRRREAERALFLAESNEARVQPDKPNENIAKSTTLQATGAAGISVGVAATAVGSTAEAVSALSPTAQAILIGAGVVLVLSLAWIARERVRKWANGDR